MKIKSLKQELNLTLTLSILLIFSLFWLLAVNSIHQVTEDYIVTRLDHDSESLIRSLHLENEHWQITQSRIEPIYLRHGSGHYYVIQAPNQTLHSPSLGSYPLYLKPLSQANAPLVYETLGPERKEVLVRAIYTTKNGHPLTLYVAEDHSPLENSINHFVLLFGIIAFISLILLTFNQRRLIQKAFSRLKPLEKQLKQQDHSAPLTLNPEDYPQEVASLIDSLNHSFQQASQQLKRSRDANGNLAHALKTPLNLIYQQVNQIESPHLKQQMQQQADKIYQLIERELKRARIANQPNNEMPFTQTDLHELIQTIQQLYHEKALHITLNANDFTQLPMDQEDGYELLGNLLDNAAKWANSQIHIQISDHQVIIEDNGPGISDQDLSHIQQRGHRLDESIPGHGLGLSIVHDILDVYQANIQFSNASLGGLKVMLQLK